MYSEASSQLIFRLAFQTILCDEIVCDKALSKDKQFLIYLLLPNIFHDISQLYTTNPPPNLIYIQKTY